MPPVMSPLRQLAIKAKNKGIFGPFFHGTKAELPSPAELNRPLWLSEDVIGRDNWLLGANMYTGGGRRSGPAKASDQGAALWPFFSTEKPIDATRLGIDLTDQIPAGWVHDLSWLKLLGIEDPYRFADKAYAKNMDDWEAYVTRHGMDRRMLDNVSRPFGKAMHSHPTLWDERRGKLYEYLDSPGFVEALVEEAGPAPLTFRHPSSVVRYDQRGRRHFGKWWDQPVRSTATFAPRPAEVLLGPYDFRRGGFVS